MVFGKELENKKEGRTEDRLAKCFIKSEIKPVIVMWSWLSW